jgi:RNA polymerase sigma-70 factor (ECF subfamily)
MAETTAIGSPGAGMSRTFSDLLAEVHASHSASIFRFLDRLSGDPDLAADLAQEAFVRLYRRGSLPEKPDRWLVTVALNLFRNERSKERRQQGLRVAFSGDLAPGSVPSPAEDAESRSRRAEVRSALDRLPPRDRELLLLRAEGYSYRDLADLLALHEASVGTLLARAKRAFETAYEEAKHAS